MAGNFPYADLAGPSPAGKHYGIALPLQWADWFITRVASVVQYDVMQCDVENTDATVTRTYDNSATGLFGQLIAPRAEFVNGNEGGYPVVAQTAQASDNGDVVGVWHGNTRAFIIASAGTVAIGNQLVIDTSRNFDLVKLSTEPRWGIVTDVPDDSTPQTRDSTGTVLVWHRGPLSLANATT